MWRRHHLGNHLVEIKIKSVSIHCMGRRGKAESRWSMDCNDANVLMMRVARTWPGTAFHLSSDLKMSTGRLGNNLNNNDHQQMARTMNNEHALPPTEPLTERGPITTASAKQKLASIYLRRIVSGESGSNVLWRFADVWRNLLWDWFWFWMSVSRRLLRVHHHRFSITDGSLQSILEN